MTTKLDKTDYDKIKTRGRVDGPTAEAWECFDCWLRRFWKDNPDDERSHLDLIDDFVADMEKSPV